ncbi:hypothetical protein [Geodermatophilus chilensis]|uniref:hypothetical protein n=1 Tax=Geodermatophilus chilensis TaxID=2035835 RepID=UPI0013001204|nr:hypothetical protein [Geodermatophilus chilensis]
MVILSSSASFVVSCPKSDSCRRCRCRGRCRGRRDRLRGKSLSSSLGRCRTRVALRWCCSLRDPGLVETSISQRLALLLVLVALLVVLLLLRVVVVVVSRVVGVSP